MLAWEYFHNVDLLCLQSTGISWVPEKATNAIDWFFVIELSKQQNSTIWDA